MNDPIRNHIASLRAAVQKKYDDGMEAIATLEQTLLGSGAEPDMEDVTDLKESLVPPMATKGPARSSNVSIVLESIREDFKTVEEIASDTGLDEDAVRYALYQDRAKRSTERRRTAVGNRKKYRLKQAVTESTGPGVAESVRSILKQSNEPLRPKDIIACLPQSLQGQDKINKAVSTALYNMKKAGAVTHNEADSTYMIGS